MEKTCEFCELTKSISEFYDKRYTWCKDCIDSYGNSKAKDNLLKKRYGISIATYNKMLKSQNYSCAICDTHISELTVNLAVDHCHKTKTIRGLLCYNCNSGIGRFKDSIELLKKAINYLNSDEEHIN